MARRTYRRRLGSAVDWLPATAPWPVVFSTALPPYASILKPRVSGRAGQCSPSDLSDILKVTPMPALRQALSSLKPIDPPEPRLSGDFPKRPDLPVLPIPPTEPVLDDYRAPPPEDTALRRVGRALFGKTGPTFEERRRYDAAMAAFEQAWRQYEGSHRSYEQGFARIQADQAAYDQRRTVLNASLAEAKATYLKARADRAAAVTSDADAVERLLDDAAENRSGGVASLAEALWRAIPLPADFPRSCEVAFEEESGVLLITIEAPDFERVALTTALKTGRKAVGERVRRAAQQTVNHVLPLRIAHEIYASPEMEAVQLVGVNVRLAYIDRRNGQPRHEVVASMTATRAEFEPLNISEVDPKKCFRGLRGVETPRCSVPR